MRITNRFRTRTAAADSAPLPAGCRGTLVLHADGSAECEHEATCGLDELQHDLWVSCDELRCGCVGEDAPLPLAA